MNLFEFFDKFGIVLFTLFVIDSLFYIKKGKKDFRVYALGLRLALPKFWWMDF